MNELTIASFNTHWGRGPRGLDYPAFDVVDACRRLDADVLVLQESWAPDNAESDHAKVAAALNMQVAAQTSLARADIEPKPKVTGRTSSRGGDGSWVLALLTRLEVRSAEVIPLPHLWLDPVDRAVLAVELAVNGSPFHLRATHLPHLEMGVYLSTLALRRALPDPTVAAAFVGDMNMWGWSIDAMVPRGWRRVVRGKTFPAHRPHSQIDHLLVTPSVEVVSSAVGPDLGSDHLPIRARVRWA